MTSIQIGLAFLAIIGIVLVISNGKSTSSSNQIPAELPSKPVEPSGVGTEITASVYSASDVAGGYGIPPSNELHTYSPSPVEMMSAAGPIRCISHSINGLRASELRVGGIVKSGVPGIGDSGVVTVMKFTEQLKKDSSQVIIYGVGMVDCFFDDVTLPDYMSGLQADMQAIKDAGKLPVIKGYHAFIQTELMTPYRLSRHDEFNAAIQAYAEANDIEFLDMMSTSYAGQADMAPDMLHRSFDSHKVLAIFIAKRLGEIAKKHFN